MKLEKKKIYLVSFGDDLSDFNFSQKFIDIVSQKKFFYFSTTDLEALEKLFVEGVVSLSPVLGSVSMIPAIGNIPASYLTNGHTASGYSQIVPYFKDADFGKLACELFSEMIKTGRGYKGVWDEEVYYRFVAMNEFLNSGENLSYSEFLEQKQDVIDELFMNSTSKHYPHTDDLFEACTAIGREASLMSYLFDGDPTFISTFNGMNKEELMGIVFIDHEIAIERPYSITGKKKKKILLSEVKDIVSLVRSGEGIKTSDEIADILLRALLTSVETFGTGNKFLNDFVSALVPLTNEFKRIIGHKKKQVFATRVSKIADKITPVEILSLVYATISYCIIAGRSSRREALSVISEAMIRSDDGIDFAVLVSQLVMEYDGFLPKYSNWIKAISDNDIDWTLGAVIVSGLVGASGQSELALEGEGNMNKIRERFADY